MATSKKYISERSNFTIHRPPHFIQEKFQGDVVNTRIEPPPIEFTNGTYETDDPEEQAAIEDCAAYGANLSEGDVAPHPTESEFEEAVEEAPDSGPSLEEQLEAANTPAEVQAVLDEHNLPGLPTGTQPEGAESGDDSGADGDENAPASGEGLTLIQGVSKKAEAIAALESTDLDVTVSESDTVEDIVAFANQHGYGFEDWP